jgi:dTMP kinase
MTVQKKHGFFICIEGLDGSGKTTQAKRLVKNLRQRGFDVDYTCEPSKGVVGKLIRSFVLNREKRVSIALEALLFAADRADHVENGVKPMLQQGRVVVCDRYVFSTLAYQGAAGLDLEWIESINQFALKPDLALFIDVPAEIVVGRLKREKTVMETKLNQKKVREVYLKLVERQRLKLVKGDETKNKVAQSILKIVLGMLKTKG